MKLISTFFSTKTAKTLAAAMFMLVTISGYTRISHAAPPPVFWNVFDVTVKNYTTVVVKWTVTEYNNERFYIQHSADGIEWENIALIQSKKSPESLVDYSYSFTNELAGKQYYRIKHVDIDTIKSGYSKVMAVEFNPDKLLAMPNPATNQITIVNNSIYSYTQAELFDLSGKLVIEKKLESHTNTININDLKSGTYLLKVRSSNGTIYHQKIIKQ
jgi:hypothetical protein